MTKESTFAQVKNGGLFFRDRSPEALPYIKISDKAARTPSGMTLEIAPYVRVYETNLTIRQDV